MYLAMVGSGLNPLTLAAMESNTSSSSCLAPFIKESHIFAKLAKLLSQSILQLVSYLNLGRLQV